jgi:hypothetical protein
MSLLGVMSAETPCELPGLLNGDLSVLDSR